LEAAFRPLDPSRWRTLSEARTGVAQGIPARGGMGKDKFERRKDEWTHRFYKEVAAMLEQTISANGVQHLVLLGPANYLQDFRSVLNQELNQRIIECLPQPANPAATAQEILSLVEPCLLRHQQAKEAALLEQLRETGVTGLEATLEALQEGRLQIIVAQQAEHTLYRCTESAYVTASLSSLARHCPQQAHELVLLHDVLPELAERYAARLCYLAQVSTLDEWVGLAGLKRW
jgi:peptide subunit release factor 1 (eRF1)